MSAQQLSHDAGGGYLESTPKLAQFVTKLGSTVPKDGNTDCERILVVINFKGESRKNLASRVSQEQAKQTNKLLILNINFRDDISPRGKNNVVWMR